jgi:hypothetical protein
LSENTRFQTSHQGTSYWLSKSYLTVVWQGLSKYYNVLLLYSVEPWAHDQSLILVGNTACCAPFKA